MSLWPAGGNNWAFMPWAPAGDFTILDAYIGPDKKVWVYWNKSTTHYVTIMDPDDYSIYDTYTNPTIKLSSYTETRGSIVVNKDGLGVIAYQEGSSGGGIGTWVRTIDEDGNFGTEVLANDNFRSWPTIALYNACSDIILGTADEDGGHFYPFSTSTEAMDTIIETGANTDILYGYTATPKAIAVDPFTNDIHFVQAGSIRHDSSGAGPASDELCIIHYWQVAGQWYSDTWEPASQVSRGGSYIMESLRFELDRTGTQEAHIVFHTYYNSASNSRRIIYAYKPLAGSWTKTDLYMYGSGLNSDFAIDAAGTIHVHCEGSECPAHHQSNRPGYVCAYSGSGVQYYRKAPLTTMFENDLIIKGYDLCNSAGPDPITNRVAPTEILTPRGFPQSEKLIVFSRIGYSDASSACATSDVWVYSTNADVWEGAEPPIEGEATCGVEPEAIAVNQMYAFNTLTEYDSTTEDFL